MRPDEPNAERGLERRMARAALAKIDPEWPVEEAAPSPGVPGGAEGSSAVGTSGAAKEAGEDSPAGLAEMLSTIEALRGWQASLAELPPIELPRRAAVVPFPRWRRWGMGLAAAAVLFLAVGLWMNQQVQQLAQMPPPPAGQIPEEEIPPRFGTGRIPPKKIDEPKVGAPPTTAVDPPVPMAQPKDVPLADSANWLARAPAPLVIGKGGTPGGTEGGDGGGFGNPKTKPPRGSTKTGGELPPGAVDGGKPGGTIGGGNTKQGGTKRNPVTDPARKFLNDLEFDLRVPEKLPEGWTFHSGKVVNAERAQLTYQKAGQVLSILAWAEAGPDEGPLERAVKDRRFSVIRRGGLCLALEGTGPSAEAVIGELVPPAKK